MITIFTILVGILSAVIAFISTTHKLVDRRFNGLNQIKRPGWIVVVLVVLLISATVAQDYIKDKQNQRLQDRRDTYQRKIYDSSLVHMKNKFDTSNQKLVSIVSNVLGDYGYKLDSQNLALQSLEGVVVGKDVSPVLAITPPYFLRYFDNDSTSPMVNLKVTSKDAASSYFDIRVNIIYGDGFLPNHSSIEYLAFGQRGLMEYTKRLSKNESYINTYYLMHRKRLPICYFWIKGEYRRMDGSGIFKVDDIFYYDLNEKKGGIIDDKARSEIIKTPLR